MERNRLIALIRCIYFNYYIPLINRNKEITTLFSLPLYLPVSLSPCLPISRQYSRGSLNSTKSNQKIWQKVRISDKMSGFFDSFSDFWQKVRILFPDFLSGIRTICQKSGHIVRKKTTVQRDFFIWWL
jgi:hypothetical protein